VSSPTHSDIAGRLAGVRERIARAAVRAGRDPSAITLVAVSKTRPAEDVVAAAAAGQRLFGENYAQELRDKAQALATADVAWHFIGALQRNKVKHVVGRAALIHTVDDAELAREIDRRAVALGLRQDVLIEVNVAAEAQKHGVAPAGLAELVAMIRGLPHLALLGLMTVPPIAEDPAASQPHFRALRELAAVHGLTELSMGMTHDLEVAVEEGATLVRVGTAIFGSRT
jgi:pyridoxal phosphate enzyme (YggS family)